MSIEKIMADAKSRIGAMRIAPPAGLESSIAAAREFELVVQALQGQQDAIECWSIVEELRAEEGATIEIGGSNPDFNGQPNEVVIVTDDWTAWKPRRFGAETVLLALRAAKMCRDIAMRETDAHGRSRPPALATCAKTCPTVEARMKCERDCPNSKVGTPF